MKATLEFDLLSPEEAREHRLAVQSNDMAAFISEMNETLRKIVKYNPGEHGEEAIEVVDNIRKRFFEELEDRSLMWVLD